MRCPKCPVDLSDNDKFLMACGETQQLDVIHSNCSHSNPTITKYYLQCRKPLSLAQTAPQSETITSRIN